MNNKNIYASRFMKIFVQISIVVGLLLWMIISSLDMAGRYLIQDAIELHGSRLLGSNIQFKSYTVDWKARSVLLGELCVPSESRPDFFCMGSVFLKFKNDLMPDFKRDSLISDVLEVDAVEIKNLVVFYAVDNDAAKDELLRFSVIFSEMANKAMQKRLNSELNSEMPFLKFKIGEIRVSDIWVSANSKKNPELSKIFSVSDVLISGTGDSERGVAAVEVLDRVAQSVFEKVQRESYRQIEFMRPTKKEEASHNKLLGKEGDKNKDDSGAEGFKEIGDEIKNTGQKIWKSTKNLFD